MRQLLRLIVILTLILAACGVSSEVSDEDEFTDETPAADEIVVGDEDEFDATTTTLLLDDSEEEDAGVLEIATLLPIDSGRFEGEHWIKWQLAEPIPDPNELHITFQLNIRSAEDDVFGVGWTIPVGEEPFATGFCLDDRPNCADGTVAIEVDVSPLGDELTFRLPEGTFGNATGLEIGAFIQTFAASDADPVTEDVGEGARAPLGMEERDPC